MYRCQEILVSSAVKIRCLSEDVGELLRRWSRATAAATLLWRMLGENSSPFWPQSELVDISDTLLLSLSTPVLP